MAARTIRLPKDKEELERWLTNAYNAGYQACLRDHKLESKTNRGKL